jgi:hypothetical protein
MFSVVHDVFRRGRFCSALNNHELRELSWVCSQAFWLLPATGTLEIAGRPSLNTL